MLGLIRLVSNFTVSVFPVTQWQFGFPSLVLVLNPEPFACQSGARTLVLSLALGFLRQFNCIAQVALEHPLKDELVWNL